MSLKRFVVALCCVLATAGCAPRYTVQPVESMLTASGNDTTRLASALHERCRRVAAPDLVACYDEVFSTLAARGDVRLAMRSLERIAAIDAGVRMQGHVFAHGIGIAGGAGGQPITEAFSRCTEAFQSGCYHGIVQTRFTNIPAGDSAQLDALCAPFKGESERWLRFQCVHGLGHGLTMSNAHHLPKALLGCDLLSDAWDRSSCYGGAFMENIVNATAPHHPAHKLASAKPAGHEHASHDHAGDPDGDTPVPKFKAFDAADPHYPCSVMAEKYLIACYQMQTSVMLHITRGDMSRTALACESAPRGLKSVCFESFGRDISSYTLQSHSESIRLCSVASPVYQPWCFRGLVKNFIDVTAKAADGLDFCAKVPAGGGRSLCYLAVGEQIAVLSPTPAARRAACETELKESVAACLYGARVELVPPPGIREILDTSLN